MVTGIKRKGTKQNGYSIERVMPRLCGRNAICTAHESTECGLGGAFPTCSCSIPLEE